MNKTDILYKQITIWFIINSIACLLTHNFRRHDVIDSIDLISVATYFISNIFILYYALKLFLNLPNRAPLNIFLLGFFLFVGGAIVDIGSTFICSPDLKEEGNVLLLMLLSKNFSLNFIYTFTILFNIFEGTIYLTLWGAFLKAYLTLVKAIPYSDIFTTFRWLLGIGKMKGWYEILFNSKTDLSFLMSFLTFCWMMKITYRFYMALMWFDKVPFSYTIVPLSIFITAVLGLTFFTHYKVKKNYLKICP